MTKEDALVLPFSFSFFHTYYRNLKINQAKNKKAEPHKLQH